jgi:hypothetical protein
LNVDAFLLHLNNFSHLLREAGATKTANDLRDACELLSPFRGQKLDQVLKDCARAQQILRDGAPVKAKAGPKPTPAEIAALSDRLTALHDRAGQPGLTDEEIDSTFAAANLDALTGPQLVAIAARMNIPKLTGKPKIIEAMKKAVRDRKGALLRVGI